MNCATFAELVQTLSVGASPVGIIDTCCLLDVVQAPVRPKGLEVVQAAVRLRDRVAARPLSVALPTPVSREFGNRVAAIQVDVALAGRRASSFVETTARMGQSLGLANAPALSCSLADFGLEKQLATLAEDVMRSAQSVPDDGAIDWVARAYHRVVNREPPASPGKEAMSDCLIFEQALEIARGLQAANFPHRVVFATSNTSDFCDKSKRPLGDLVEQAADAGMLLVTGMVRLEYETR